MSLLEKLGLRPRAQLDEGRTLRSRGEVSVALTIATLSESPSNQSKRSAAPPLG